MNMAKHKNNVAKNSTVVATTEPQPSAETLVAAQKALGNSEPTTATGLTAAAMTAEIGTETETFEGDEESDGVERATGRKHGPYTTETEAKANPVHYTQGKNKGKPLAVYAVSLKSYPTVYFYGMNYHHASIQALKHWGGTVSLCGSGRGSAVAAANGRATEAEMRAAAALNDKIAAEKAAQAASTASILNMVALLRSLPENMRAMALATMQDAEIRKKVEAGLAS